MAAQDENGGTSNCILMNSVVPSSRSTQQATQDECAIKVRKPYTITKQRERWTEEEHKKFLDALKLHGRAWRRIEEHVATKTAVQIRSHAQKFFSKVVRESSGDDEKSVDPIEIPPPRPKRKPMHPYPRKLVIPVRVGPSRSLSPNLCLSEKENLSPTSVSFALDSEGQGSVDSSPNASPSCVSSATNASTSMLLASVDDPTMDVPLPGMEEFFSPDDSDIRESSTEGSTDAAQYLILFGKKVFVAGSHQSNEFPKTIESGINLVPSLPWASPNAPETLYFPCVRVHNPVPIKARALFDNKDMVEDKEFDLNEGSSTCSNSGSDTSSFRRTEIVILEQRRVGSKRRRGFLPYKRCLAEKATHSPTIIGEVKEELRANLCL